MRFPAKRSTLVVVVLFGCLAIPGLTGLSWAKDDAKLRAAIEAVNQQFVAATARGDAAALASLYADSGQVLPPGGEVLTGREALRTFWQQAIDAGKDLVVWKNEHGAWRLYRDIWNSNQPAATK